MSIHSFDGDIAAKAGINAAVIYHNIVFWTQKNLANGRHVHDGHVWTYNSVSAWGDLFPYLTADQIRRALDRLVSLGLVVVGNYNETAYDRTKWYGVSPQIHLAKTTNGFGENPEPIPDSKPDGKPDVDIGEKPKAPSRASQLPEGWVPNDRNIADALSKEFTQEEIENEAYNFQNYHIARGSKFKNWDAAWRTWIGNARKFARAPSKPTGRDSFDAARERALRSAERTAQRDPDLF